MDRTGSRSAWRSGIIVLGLLLFALPSFARHRSEAWSRNQFAIAERLREALNGRPNSERTQREYRRVIENYKVVYLGAPTSSKAGPSVEATAELMVEMGRRFNSDELLRSAIQQYEFLRSEYPGSKYRVQALFTIGEIYKDDLNDPARAREAFEEFLRRYPHTALAAVARKALAEDGTRKASVEAPARGADEDAIDDRPAQRPAAADVQPDARKADAGRPARVTGVRHWSTPDYTRVAIDVEQEVKFEAQRIGHPDRIYFDLLDTKLASTLIGKTFDVDDGFLKRVRVAQFQPGKTRIVLEVDDIGDYSAFLLPNPARLIVDIHGKQPTKLRTTKVARTTSPATSTQAAAGPQDQDKDNPTDEDAAEEQAAALPKNDGPKVSDIPPVDVAPDTVKSVRKTPAGSTVVKTVVENDDSRETTKVEVPATSKAARSKAGPSAVASSPGATKATGNARRGGTENTADIREARPTSLGDRSLIRALGLKIGRIVIDPGHGGHDTGTIGPNGLKEKTLVLDVALRLGKLLQTRLGADVVYTRKDDTFIPLETRTAIANQEQADLFVSVHANSSHDPDARGVETYYLNFTSSPEALEVAARENAVSDKSIHELQDLVKKIALKEKIDESREFASDVQQSLQSALVKNQGLRDRGVKKAPFIVLIGANMPSILAEISFVSNPDDERRLRLPEYRQKIAESLYRGVAKYVGGLSGVKVATKLEKTTGQ